VTEMTIKSIKPDKRPAGRGSAIAVHVAHAAFLPERKDTLARLMAQLEPQGARVTVHRSEQREPACVWALRLYKAAAAEDAPGAIYLNDDVEVAPSLIAACEAFLDLPTSRIVSLAVVHPMCRSLSESGQRWLSTYHVTGPGYMTRRGVPKQIVRYYGEMPKAWTTKVNEDNVLISFLFRHREPAWSCIPGLVIHDATVPSSYGYDNHPGRICPVPWTDPAFADLQLGDPATWASAVEPAFLETHWTDERTLLSQEISNDLGIAPEMCWFCGKVPFQLGSQETGARVCLQCHFNLLANVYSNAAKNIANGGGVGPK
jgi:hypothetical protein